MPIVGVSGSDTESDVPRRRRLRVVWNADPHSEAQTALTLLQVLARRVGAVPVGAPIPVAIRHHRWSPLFVPLLWGAAGVDATTPVLDMLMSTASGVQEPIQFHGSDISAMEAVRVGWTTLRAVLRTWGVGHAVAPLQLVEEPGVHDNPAWSPHSDTSTRTHFVTDVRGGCTGGNP